LTLFKELKLSNFASRCTASISLSSCFSATVRNHQKISLKTKILPLDTLLNVFLAIAVDNLANAQELTAAEEADEKANEIFEDSESIEEYQDDQVKLAERIKNFNASFN
jgi:hypothetical protein